LPLVVDGIRMRLSGLVSMEDVIETLLGTEIMDETDNVADLQLLARKNWKQGKRSGCFWNEIQNNLKETAYITHALGVAKL